MALTKLWTTILQTCLLAGIALLIFVTIRHAQIAQRRRSCKWPNILQPEARSIKNDSHQYNLFVLGSGGHTKEMLMMMDDGFCDFDSCHRRYLISSGDKMSLNHLQDYEDSLGRLCQSSKLSPGTYDVRTVTRARRVHQALWTTPFTAFLSILDIFPAILSPPGTVARKSRRFPRLIFSNGPATGFFVALAAHALKIFYLVPETDMKFVYIESWARISSLSLTGKLLHHTGIADVFLVQHQGVATKYGVRNAGEMVFNTRRGDI
ncbi:UDP-N-acetylglucosamine transferase subunit alg14 [Paramyrothecium foliicola]|nr:UDP-N-acetylglucosamine transferase subunit alg14 [Paramyrothecium foliicola]